MGQMPDSFCIQVRTRDSHSFCFLFRSTGLEIYLNKKKKGPYWSLALKVTKLASFLNRQGRIIELILAGLV
jgi:hypothetical protein